MSKVYVETMNGNGFIFEYQKIKRRIDVRKLLEDAKRHLEEDDAFSLYTMPFDGAKCYKISFFSEFDSVRSVWYATYVLELVDHSEGEAALETVYRGKKMEDMQELIWEKRTLINKGFNEL